MKTDIMTIDKVSTYLKLKTAYHHAVKGSIPAFRVGSSWRFCKSETDKRIKTQEMAGVQSA
jgi:hypothetical protein